MHAAEQLCATALAGNPLSVPATILRGLICARTGKKAAAIAYLQNAARRDPESFEARVALSTLLFSSGRANEAIEIGREAIALRPHDPDSYAHLARDLRAHERPTHALDLFRKAAELAPQDKDLIRDLAALLLELGLLHESMKRWEDLAALTPGDADPRCQIARLHLANSDIDKAIASAREAVQADGESAEAHFLLGLALSEKGRADEAETWVGQAIELNPSLPLAHATLGLIYHEQGRFDEARPVLEKSIELWPTNGLAYYTLLRTRKVKEEDESLLEQIEGLSDDPSANLVNRSYMHYALGKAREDLDDYERAMLQYNAATSLAYDYWFAAKPWDKDRYRFNFDRTIETFSSDNTFAHAKSGLGDETPLFVVGMIRSGTTLVEQILSSHPQIGGGGELQYWHEHAGRIFDPVDRTVDEKLLLETGRAYLELLKSLAPHSARVTDKLPHNFALIGLIHAALPNARFIHIRRHPLDNCLSVFTTAYPYPPAFTLNRANIVYAFREYRRMMAHWRSFLPSDRLLEIDYEELIENREEVVRRLIAFTELEWDEACMHHELNDRFVHTPSVWQVRQPAYKTSIGRWTHFEPWLGEFNALRQPRL